MTNRTLLILQRFVNKSNIFFKTLYSPLSQKDVDYLTNFTYIVFTIKKEQDQNSIKGKVNRRTWFSYSLDFLKKINFPEMEACLPKRTGCLIILFEYSNLAKIEKQKGNDQKLLHGQNGEEAQKNHTQCISYKLSPLN